MDETSSGDSDGQRYGFLNGAVLYKKAKTGAKRTAKTLEVVGRHHLHLHTHQHIFSLTLNRKTHQPIMGRLQIT